jgi:hypothetical protein
MNQTEAAGDRTRGLLGKEEVFRSSEELGQMLIRRFAAAVGSRNPAYWKQGDPREIAVPPTLIFELTYDLRGTIDPKTGLYEGLHRWAGSPKQLDRAGNDYRIVRPARADDVVSVHKKIVEVTEKKGKTGTWTFITTAITFTNQRNEILGTDRETLACRY